MGLKYLLLGLIVMVLVLPSMSTSVNAQWWNDSWNSCYNVTLTDSVNVERRNGNDPVWINLTSLGVQNTYEELRIINSGCNTGGSEVPRHIISNTTDSAFVTFLGNATNFSVYFDTSFDYTPFYTTGMSVNESFANWRTGYNLSFNSNGTDLCDVDVISICDYSTPTGRVFNDGNTHTIFDSVAFAEFEWRLIHNSSVYAEYIGASGTWNGSMYFWGDAEFGPLFAFTRNGTINSNDFRFFDTRNYNASFDEWVYRDTGQAIQVVTIGAPALKYDMNNTVPYSGYHTKDEANRTLMGYLGTTSLTWDWYSAEGFCTGGSDNSCQYGLTVNGGHDFTANDYMFYLYKDYNNFDFNRSFYDAESYRYQNNLTPTFGPGELKIKFELVLPSNITIYNNLTAVTYISNLTNVINMNYSLNGGSNLTYINNSLLNVSIGPNFLVVYANNTTHIVSDSVNFFVKMICNSTFANNKVCGGYNARYVVNCTIENGLEYDWSRSNLTLCQNGCSNGACQDVSNNCISYCNPNTGQTVCGGQQNKFVLQCTDEDSDGCFDWSGSNITFCRNGCGDGQCLNGTNQCIPGSTRCVETDIVVCRDTNNDTFFEWDFGNVTYCKFECFEEVVGNIRNVFCEEGSGNFTIWYGVNSAFKELGVFSDIIFYTSRLKAVSIFVFGFILAFIAVIYTRDFTITSAVFFMVMLVGTIAGWMPWYITILFAIFMVVIIKKN